MMLLFTFFVVLGAFVSAVCLQCSAVVYIQPTEEEKCPENASTCVSINDFGKMVNNLSFYSAELVVHFIKGTHSLSLRELVVFSNLSNAIFKGEERILHETLQSAVVINCTQYSGGFAFINSSMIIFQYINITNCGGYVKDFSSVSFSDLSDLQKAALGFFNVGSVSIDYVSVKSRSQTSGLVVITSGCNLTISNSLFTKTAAGALDFITGANVAIIYTDPTNCIPHKSANVLVSNTSVTDKCIGIHILLAQSLYRVDLVLDSVVSSGNIVANIVILSREIVMPTYNLTLINSVIGRTFANDGYGLVIITGPKIANHFDLGIDVPLHCSYAQNLPVPNATITIANSVFNYSVGSGIWIGFENVKYISNVLIASTKICHNFGSVSGLLVYSNAYQGQVYVTLTNVTLYDNKYIPRSAVNTIFGFGNKSSAIYAYLITILKMSNVSITSSINSTGLTTYSTAVVLCDGCTSIIHNNTGFDGGGLAMYGNSYLFLGEDSVLTFTNNTAKRGGAIFVDTGYYAVSTPICFFQMQYDDDFSMYNSATVYFSGNQATIAGSVLYGGNIDDCLLLTQTPALGRKYFNETFDYSTQHGRSVLSSEPLDVCFCENNVLNCNIYILDNLSAYPGKQVKISVAPVGQHKGIVPGVIEVQYNFQLAQPQYHNAQAQNCTTINITQVYNDFFNYSIYSLGVLISNPMSRFLNITLTNCPPGFRMSNKTKICDCEHLTSITESIKCDAATNTLKRQGDVWVGMAHSENNSSHCLIVRTPCPFDYCNTNSLTFPISDPDSQCALNRRGVLCGECKNNYSLALGSNNCVPCPDSFHLLYIIPFVAAGFSLVIFLMGLNLTVSIGTINGLIFYASIVQISESTGIFDHRSTPVLTQFIAWLNLDLGIETCLYKEMTAYQKVWLQFAFPLYIWFIIAMVIVLCRYSKWLSNKVGGNIVQVLATLILLSFTKIFRTFAPALTWIHLTCVNTNKTTAVWYVDGNVQHSSVKQALLISAAVLFLLLAVPYTLALLLDPLIERYLTRVRVFRNWWVKFKPFTDAYHGPYKDNCRFWTGLLLLIRMVFTLVSVFLDTYTTLVFITTSTTVLLALMVFFGGTYQNKYLNALECTCLLNLALLSAIYNPWYDKVKGDLVEITIVSLSVAFVMFVGVLVYHLYQRLIKINCFKKLFIDKINRSANEEPEPFLEDEDDMFEQLVEPTSSIVCMRRETMINSNYRY